MHSPSNIIMAAESQANSSPSTLPRLLFIEDISRLSGITETTIRSYTGNRERWGHLLPPWFKLPGGRRLVWRESDVLAWIEAGRAAAEQPRRPGRPKKAVQLRAAGLL